MSGRFVAVKGEILSEVVSEVPWCEDTYQINADSRSLSHIDGLEELYNIITRECALGHLVRQELVSMIPALMLGVEPFHMVLDMCAAPGSKTEQLLGFMNFKNSTGNVLSFALQYLRFLEYSLLSQEWWLRTTLTCGASHCLRVGFLALGPLICS
jgi:16S rRNA C967 or C1407 C5-methylase (RsmB/RsmF family)